MDGLLMRFLGHSTVRLEIAGRVVLTDPVLTARVGGLTRVAPPLEPRMWAGVGLVLISHLHGDHLHVPSLRLLDDVPIVVPRGAGKWLRTRGFTHVRELDVGEELVEGGLRVTALRAEHSGHRWGPRFTHGPQAPALGYLVEGDGSRVYVAGDTDLYDGMAELSAVDSRVDVALLPVWGWGPNLGPGHLDPERAAEAVRLVRPRITVPVHWGTLAVPGLARTRRMRRLLVEPPHRFAAAAAGQTEVLVTQPGDEVALSEVPR
ncbi:MAG TPA: MBL fold metallo-hydrolase [Amycolatopsis sp.]|nr:MBL fold metallo-hydrolase [Amycolatopsis sp.]